MYKYPETIELYMSVDEPHHFVTKAEKCCNACYWPARTYSIVTPRAMSDSRPKETTVKVKVEADTDEATAATDDLLKKVAEITALVEQCNDMTKEVRKNLDTIKPQLEIPKPPKVSAMTQMVRESSPVSSFPPAPRSIP